MDKLIYMLKVHEGVRNKMYKCSEGYNTIGVGHNLDAKPISDAAIEQILKDDIEDVVNQVQDLPFWNDISDVRQAVIIDMCFNLGYEGFLKFKKTIAAIAMDDFVTAANEMMDSKWSKQVGSRAKRLQKMMLTNEWQT